MLFHVRQDGDFCEFAEHNIMISDVAFCLDPQEETRFVSRKDAKRIAKKEQKKATRRALREHNQRTRAHRARAQEIQDQRFEDRRAVIEEKLNVETETAKEARAIGYREKRINEREQKKEKQRQVLLDDGATHLSSDIGRCGEGVRINKFGKWMCVAAVGCEESQPVSDNS